MRPWSSESYALPDAALLPAQFKIMSDASSSRWRVLECLQTCECTVIWNDKIIIPN
jgi:hypothetical protein